MESRLKILQSMPIFGGITDATLTYLLERAEILDVATGGYFFREQEIDNSIYILEQGRVTIYRTWQGREYHLRDLATGDCFGEMALMDCKPRSAAVRALEPCRAIRIEAGLMYQLYGVDPEQYLMIYMNLGREVCRRLRDADNRLFLKRCGGDDPEQ
ncbi:MAG: cyclic nucleotide-binding domain-containing protein [Candidatus Thiodiazotropha sp.]